jgi:hypothetical protein
MLLVGTCWHVTDRQDDAWGNFTNAGPSQPADNANPFDDFRPDPLTPHDWASEFDREFSSDNWTEGSGKDAPTIVVPDDDNDDEETSPRPGSTWSFSGDDEGEDLPPTLSPKSEDAPRLGAPIDDEKKVTQGMSGLSLTAPRDPAGQVRRSPPPPPPRAAVSLTPRTDAFFATPSKSVNTPISPLQRTPSPSKIATSPTSSISTTPLQTTTSNTGSDPIPDRTPAPLDIPVTRQRSSSQSESAFSPPDSSLVQATSPDAPLGPGVSRDAELTEEGMVSREVDGQVITVPADEIVRGVEDAMERNSESSEGRGSL